MTKFIIRKHTDNTREFTITANDRHVDLLQLGVLGLVVVVGIWKELYLLTAVVAALSLHWKYWSIKSETFTVIRDLGVQITTTYYSGKHQTQFIDKSQISEIIINEGITLWTVKFYLAIMIEGQDKMVVVFKHFMPRLNILLQVYRGARAVIFGEPELEHLEDHEPS